MTTPVSGRYGVMLFGILFALLKGAAIVALTAWLLPIGSHAATTYILWVLGLAVLAWLYTAGVKRDTANINRLAAGQTITVGKSLVPEPTAQRLIAEFRSKPQGLNYTDNQIFWVSRKTRVFLVARLLVVVLVLPLLLLFISMLQALYRCVTTDVELALGSRCPTSQLFAAFNTKSVTATLIIGLALGWIVWIIWSSSYVVITDTRILLIRSFPPILFFVPDGRNWLDIRSIGTAGVSTNLIGKLFNYGTIASDSSAQKDRAFNRITGIPQASTADQIINAATHQSAR